MKSRIGTQAGAEALFDESDTDFSGAGTHAGTNPAILNDKPAGTFTSGTGDTTANMEAQGDSANNAFAEMAFSIEKATVTATTKIQEKRVHNGTRSRP